MTLTIITKTRRTKSLWVPSNTLRIIRVPLEMILNLYHVLTTLLSQQVKSSKCSALRDSLSLSTPSPKTRTCSPWHFRSTSQPSLGNQLLFWVRPRSSENGRNTSIISSGQRAIFGSPKILSWPGTQASSTNMCSWRTSPSSRVGSGEWTGVLTCAFFLTAPKALMAQRVSRLGTNGKHTLWDLACSTHGASSRTSCGCNLHRSNLAI